MSCPVCVVGNKKPSERSQLACLSLSLSLSVSVSVFVSAISASISVPIHLCSPAVSLVAFTTPQKLLGSFANAIEADVMRVASREVKNFQMLKGVMLEAQKPKPKGAPGHAVNTKKQKKKKKEEDAARRLLEQAKAKKEEEARKRGGKRIKKPSRHEQKHQLPKDALGLPKER